MRWLIREDNEGKPLTVFQYDDAGPWERYDWKKKAWVDGSVMLARALVEGDPLFIPVSKKAAEKAIKDGPKDA